LGVEVMQPAQAVGCEEALVIVQAVAQHHWRRCVLGHWDSRPGRSKCDDVLER